MKTEREKAIAKIEAAFEKAAETLSQEALEEIQWAFENYTGECLGSKNEFEGEGEALKFAQALSDIFSIPGPFDA